jgi:hypothetical protein
MARTQGCYQEAEVQLTYAYERENPVSLFHCGFPNEFGIFASMTSLTTVIMIYTINQFEY